MEQSKFNKILNKLTDRQKQRYLEFLRSPYFNKNEYVVLFVGQILASGANLSKEEIYLNLFPDRAYEERKVSDLMYMALRLLEEFLTEEQYAGQAWERKLNLLTYIREQSIEDLNKGVQKDIQEIRSSKTIKNSEYFYEEFLYQSEADKIFLSQARTHGDQSLQKKVDQLDLFYLSAKLRDSCEMTNRTNIVAATYEFHLLDKLLEAIQANPELYLHYPAIAVYFHILLMLKEPEEIKHFNALKEDIGRHVKVFPKDEQLSIYGYLRNYCIRKVNSGGTVFYSELLDIYKHMIEMGLMEADNKSLQWDFKNMVSVALRVGEFEWTYELINNIKSKLPEKVRDNAYTYNLAHYYYQTKEAKKAIRLLRSVEFTDVYYNLDSKVMLLKIYFEEEEEEAFYALVAAFKVYLLRNKLISKDTFVIYNNLVKYARKAFAYKAQLPYQRKGSAKQIALLNEKVLETAQIANRDWLLKEISEIMI